MKVRLTYKNPDALHYAVDDAMQDFDGDKLDERVQREHLTDRLIQILGSSEYLTVEVDLDTAHVEFVKYRR